MRLLFPPMETIAGICGFQTLNHGTSLRMTTLCVKAACEDGILLYHTLTGALLLVSEDPFTKDARSLAGAEREELIRNWFLVPEDFAERTFVRETQKVVQLLGHQGGAKTRYTILTTTGCNARCFYCYELGIPVLTMTEQTALAAAEYMIRNSSGKPLKLSWFGGEPLYNRDAIETICRELNRHSMAFESTMVSNGYYLDEKTIERAYKEWRLKKVQITIDGTEETYNRTKAYIDQDETISPFLRVLNHIRLCAEAGIQVSIRLNMDAQNAADLLLLTQELISRFEGQPHIGIYPALLQQFRRKIHAHETMQELLRDVAAIEENLEAHGLMKEEQLFRVIRKNRCMADNEQGEVILPDGRTGRCEHFSDDVITGDIYHKEKNEEIIRKWKEPLEVPECASCALYPVCTRLQWCQWNREGCPEAERMISLNTLQKQIRNASIRYRQEGQN